jgi:hypothetical protein
MEPIQFFSKFSISHLTYIVSSLFDHTDWVPLASIAARMWIHTSTKVVRTVTIRRRTGEDVQCLCVRYAHFSETTPGVVYNVMHVLPLNSRIETASRSSSTTDQINE